MLNCKKATKKRKKRNIQKKHQYTKLFLTPTNDKIKARTMVQVTGDMSNHLNLDKVQNQIQVGKKT